MSDKPLRENPLPTDDEVRYLAPWWAECDKVGVPRDPTILVRHHRGNGKLIGASDMLGEALRKVAEIRGMYQERGRDWAQSVEACERIRKALLASREQT